VAISKEFEVPWPHEKSDIEFRCELFNAFNHPQFSNPDANFSPPTFGVIYCHLCQRSGSATGLKAGFLAWIIHDFAGEKRKGALKD